MNYKEAYYKCKLKYLSLKNRLCHTGGGIQQQNTDTGDGVILI